VKGIEPSLSAWETYQPWWLSWFQHGRGSLNAPDGARDGLGYWAPGWPGLSWVAKDRLLELRIGFFLNLRPRVMYGIPVHQGIQPCARLQVSVDAGQAEKPCDL